MSILMSIYTLVRLWSKACNNTTFGTIIKLILILKWSNYRYALALKFKSFIDICLFMTETYDTLWQTLFSVSNKVAFGHVNRITLFKATFSGLGVLFIFLFYFTHDIQPFVMTFMIRCSFFQTFCFSDNAATICCAGSFSWMIFALVVSLRQLALA